MAKNKYKEMIKTLDKLAAEYVLLRDNNACVRCGKVAPYTILDCSHVIGRANKRTRWFPQNLKALCRECHMWWHANPEEAIVWFELKFPVRFQKIEEERIRGPRRYNIGELEQLKILFEASIKMLKECTEILPF